MSPASRAVLLLAVLLIRLPIIAQTQAKASGWVVREKRDAFPDEQTSEPTLSVPANFEDRRGRARVSARCGEAPNSKTPLLAFEISYHSETEKDLAFETSGLDASVIPDFQTAMELGFKTYLNALANPQAMYDTALHAARNTPVVRFRVKVDDKTTTGYSRSNYSNVLTVNFYDGWNREKVLSPPYGTNQLPPVGSLAAGLAAQHIMVELPLANSDRPIVEIDLKDRGFRDYAAHCVAAVTARNYDPNGPPSAIMADGYVLGTMSSYSERTTLDSAGGFATDFPSFLQKAMAGSQMHPEDYAKEIDYIQKAVRTCGSITPAMAQSFVPDGKPNPAQLGERFKPCALSPLDSIDVTDAVKGYSPHKGRGIRLWIRPDDGRGDQWGTGHRFDVEVRFDELKGDPDIGFGKNAAYLIVLARLTENSVGPDGGAPPRDHLQDARNHMGLRQYDPALADYKLTLADNPDNAEAKAGVAAIENLPNMRTAFLDGLQGNGIWLDQQTKLLWTLRDSDQDLYQSASYLYCANLKLNGLTNWRLPVLSELQGIYDPRASGAYRIKGGITLRGRAGWVWAQGVETTQGQNLRFFSFQTGRVHDEFAYNYASFNARAICVRPYQPDVDGLPNPLVAAGSATASAPPKSAALSAPAGAPVLKAFISAHDQSDTSAAASSSKDPATSYYMLGLHLLSDATNDPKTGKLLLPRDCEAAFRKYLELAPKGEHVADIRKIFELAGMR